MIVMKGRVLSLLAGLLLASLARAGVEITKCCPEGQELLLQENLCSNRTEDLQLWGKFPPKVFSLDAGAFVTETLVVGATSLPRCEEGETLRRLERAEESEESEERFLILSEDRTLFLPGQTASYPSFCLDSGGGVTVALVCRPDPSLQCRHSVCVSSCCPASMVFSPLAEDCVFSENYTLRPPFPASPLFLSTSRNLTTGGAPHCLLPSLLVCNFIRITLGGTTFQQSDVQLKRFVLNKIYLKSD